MGLVFLMADVRSASDTERLGLGHVSPDHHAIITDVGPIRRSSRVGAIDPEEPVAIVLARIYIADSH